jgi:GNAT superfamily N-acetyltransferase
MIPSAFDFMYLNPETALDRMMRAYRNQTGLDFVQITDQRQLDGYLDRGLAALYQRVFAGPPYNEQFTLSEVKDTFKEFLDKKGVVIIATDPKNNNAPAAFVASVPLKSSFELAAIARNRVDVDKAGYFAEDGVDEAYRRRGLSMRMKQLLLEANREQGLPQMLLRTSNDNYPQISAVNKAGGRVLSGVFQTVARKRMDGSVTPETSAFYLFDKNVARPAEANPFYPCISEASACVSAIDNVLILRDGASDKALVLSNVTDKQAASAKLRDVYAGISAVAYASDADVEIKGKPVFSGRLYIAGEKPKTDPAPKPPRKKFLGLL